MIAEQLLFTGEIIAAFVTMIFFISLLMKRNDIMDVFWGIGIFGVALISYLTGPQNNLTLILTILAALWGLRLSLRIYLRNRKKEEDYRYKAWRDSWGKWFYLRSYLQIYVLQGFLMIVVGYSFVHAAIYTGSAHFGIVGILGILVWTIGYFFEVVGDYQLDQFIKNPRNRGEIMDKGLWKYTRHPNYFGEVTMWWGIWLLIAPLPFGIYALISPLAITFLILKVSGIPMLEKKYADDPKFQEYKRRTSVFLPLPSKK